MKYQHGDCLWDAKPVYWYTVHRRRRWVPWSQWKFTGTAYTNQQHANISVDEMNRTDFWWSYRVDCEVLPTYPDGTIDWNWYKIAD